MSALFDIASLSTASMDLAAPQCTISLQYAQKWTAAVVLPLLLVGVFTVGICASVLLRAVQGVITRWRDNTHEHGVFRARGALSTLSAAFFNGIEGEMDTLIGAILTVLYFSYFITLQRSLEVFKCTQDPTSLRWMLDVEPSMSCWGDNGQALLVPFAVATLVFYGCGVPVLFVVVFHRHGDAIRKDQQLWLGMRLRRMPSALQCGGHAQSARGTRLRPTHTSRFGDDTPGCIKTLACGMGRVRGVVMSVTMIDTQVFLLAAGFDRT